MHITSVTHNISSPIKFKPKYVPNLLADLTTKYFPLENQKYRENKTQVLHKYQKPSLYSASLNFSSLGYQK